MTRTVQSGIVDMMSLLAIVNSVQVNGFTYFPFVIGLVPNVKQLDLSKLGPVLLRYELINHKLINIKSYCPQVIK